MMALHEGIMLRLDHIAVAADTLDAGVAYVEDALGVKVQPGGQHLFMGTHNCLLRLGAGEYLEVIAVDPALPAPDRARWFGLDHPVGRPRVVHWIVGVDDIARAVKTIPYAEQTVVDAQRGDLKWKITIPDDGHLPFDGAFPTLIEWPKGPHVSERMNDMGCRMERLQISHPQAKMLQVALKSHLSDQRIVFQAAPTYSCVATIATPTGLKTLA
jgi:catechol 2,3-dioxygenase-like lactoylglutathione lyase family enzyme